jgi:hypothetical protein
VFHNFDGPPSANISSRDVSDALIFPPLLSRCRTPQQCQCGDIRFVAQYLLHSQLFDALIAAGILDRNRGFGNEELTQVPRPMAGIGTWMRA